MGDVMIDAYMWGVVRRVSPEAPVPVVEIERRERRVGGAGNVVKNLDSLGAQVDVIALVGDDEAGLHLQDLLAGMSTPHLLQDPGRPTTVKTRVISNGQHVVRVDEESTDVMADWLQTQALDHLQALLHGNARPDVVIWKITTKAFSVNP